MTDELIARAKKRFKSCVDWESDFRARFKDDMLFLFADSDNHDQWNAAVRAQRQVDNRPMLTINKTHTHWLHVVNDGKENKPSVKVHPTGSEATYQASQIFESIIRHIEYMSNAQTAYDIASEAQVGGGIGYIRVITDYTDDNGFDQEIFIRPVPDALAVYLDPNIKERDGSDAKFGFIYDEWPRDKFEEKYPDEIPSSNGLDLDTSGWLQKDKVRVAEYYEVEEKKEWMYAMPSDDGLSEFVRESQMSKEQVKLLRKMKGGDIPRRRVIKRDINWYLIAGNKVVDQSRWAGKYVPIVRFIGEEVVLDGKLDRKGLVRYMKDAQRMYNYNSSAAIEFGALQAKSPWLAPVEAIEGLENYWSTANTQNHAYLPYNNADENGNQIQMPQRMDPPTAAPAYIQGMATAAQEMMMSSGQYEATFSEQGNEISGVAIDGRKKQGERATFHFTDNRAVAIRFLGKILIDLIPKIYDTKRVIRIMAEDGEEQEITIDPQARQALQQQKDQENNIVKTIFNPSVGTYDVVAEVGPNYTTKREEAFKSMTDLLAAQPALAQVIGDLYMQNGDFPTADKLAERMRNWIKVTSPGILGDVDPQIQQLQQQLQQAAGIIQQLQQELQSKQNLEKIEKQRADIDALNHMALRMENTQNAMIKAFEAETKRIQAVAENMTPAAMEPIVRKMLQEIMQAPDPLMGDDPGELTGAAAYGMGMNATTVGQPLVQEPQPTGQPG